MRHQNSVFHAVLKHVPWAPFEQLVIRHRADARVRRLPAKSQFVALLYAQLFGAASLRDLMMRRGRRGLRRAGVRPSTSSLDQPAAERAQRRLGPLLRRRLRRQAARDLRCERRHADLRGGQRGQGQRHHRRARHAGRARRHLRVRPRLLRLWLVGPRWTGRNAASSAGSSATRRSPRSRTGSGGEPGTPPPIPPDKQQLRSYDAPA